MLCRLLACPCCVAHMSLPADHGAPLPLLPQLTAAVLRRCGSQPQVASNTTGRSRHICHACQARAAGAPAAHAAAIGVSGSGSARPVLVRPRFVGACQPKARHGSRGHRPARVQPQQCQRGGADRGGHAGVRAACQQSMRSAAVAVATATAAAAARADATAGAAHQDAPRQPARLLTGAQGANGAGAAHLRGRDAALTARKAARSQSVGAQHTGLPADAARAAGTLLAAAFGSFVLLRTGLCCHCPASRTGWSTPATCRRSCGRSSTRSCGALASTLAATAWMPPPQQPPGTRCAGGGRWRGIAWARWSGSGRPT